MNNIKKNNIKISEVFWSIDNLEFANNVLGSILGLNTVKITDKFNIYKLSDGTRIIAFSEKNSKVRIHDSSLRLTALKEDIKYAFEEFKKNGYDCFLNKDNKFGLLTLSCFAPAPYRYCEIVISSSED